MALMVHSTLAKEKVPFEPLEEGKVRIYVCGPTVYDNCHIGHARCYVSFDVIQRYLRYRGFEVRYICNITDVDDKIINRAKEEGVDPLELSHRFMEEFFKDMDSLGVQRADVNPKATDFIPQMLELVKSLLEKGHAYEVNGSVYFSVETAQKFGQLTHQLKEDMLDGARVELDEQKRDPKDFALWKAAKPGEISWESPWGPGRPGWHIECSAMSMQFLGETFDIHGGGLDLIFPHHESEIMQSENSTGKQFARYWLHNGMLNIDGEKMSKSLGNFFTIKEICEKFDPMVVRFFIINNQYRGPVDFSDKALEESQVSLERLRTVHRNLKEALEKASDDADISDAEDGMLQKVKECKERFLNAMDDDFNTREAIAALFDLTRDVNVFLSEKDKVTKATVAKILDLYDELDGVLGVIAEATPTGSTGKDAELIALLLDVRRCLREKKDWETADKIRDQLKEIGVEIEDHADGTKWFWKGA